MYEILKNKSISVIIPAFDEPKLLERIQFIENELHKYLANLEIVIICDGKGRTPIEKLKNYTKENTKIYYYEKNRGKGFALKFGTFKTTGEYIFFIDGGPELHPKDLKRFMLLMEVYEIDIVIGSKRHPLSNTNYSWFRKILSLGYQIYISALLGLKFVKDTQVGLKLFKGKILREIMPQVKTSGYSFDIELLALAHKLPNIKIIEAPVTLNMFIKTNNIHKEFFRLIKMVLEMSIDTLKIVHRIRLKRKPSKTCLETWNIPQEYLDLKPINHITKPQSINEHPDHGGLRLHRSESLQETLAEQS